MRRDLARVLPVLAFLALLYGGQWLLRIHSPAHQATGTVVACAAWLLAVFAAGTVVHECGHAVAVRLAGERVLGIQLGGQRARMTVHVGTVPVTLGIGLGGSVSYRAHRLSAARRAAILAAGPAASVLRAAVPAAAGPALGGRLSRAGRLGLGPSGSRAGARLRRVD
jgi:hypothetical protein